jgi:poly(hydroxyalkanoate) granule-associated protein
MMARKSKPTMTDDEHAIVDAVRESAQQIWQAGLGAFAKAQHEGSAWFDKLVQEGAALHALTREPAQTPSGGMADKVSRLAGQVGRQASGSWERIEKIFEERVALALRSLGVPSRDDVAKLQQEVDALREALEAATAARLVAPATSPARPRRKGKTTVTPAAAVDAAPKRRPAAAQAGTDAHPAPGSSS